MFGHFPIEITIENFKWPAMDRFTVYNAEIFCGLHSPNRTIYPETGTKLKKSRFAEHPTYHDSVTNISSRASCDAKHIYISSHQKQGKR